MDLLYSGLFIEEEGVLIRPKDSKIGKKEGTSELYSVKKGEIENYYVQSEWGKVLVDEGKIEVENLFFRAIKFALKECGYKKSDLVLVVGIGNGEITADSLGIETLKRLDVKPTKRDRYPVCFLAPSVKGVTGIESFKVVNSVVKEIQPSLIICVDVLVTKSTEYLNSLIQISPKGITPGAGVNNAKTPLCYDTLGVPVIGIGVPLLICAKDLSFNPSKGNQAKGLNDLPTLIMSTKEIDLFVKAYAGIIGGGINKAIYGKR